MSHFKWLIDTWDQKSTPNFKLLTDQNELSWMEIQEYLTWLNTNSHFLGCCSTKNTADYFMRIDKKWKAIPKSQKLNTEEESPYDHIFYDWNSITTLDEVTVLMLIQHSLSYLSKILYSI